MQSLLGICSAGLAGSSRLEEALADALVESLNDFTLLIPWREEDQGLKVQTAKSFSLRFAAVVLTPSPRVPQGVLRSTLPVPESRRVCWGPHSRSRRAAGCAGVPTPGPGEPQGVLGSSLLVLECGRVCWSPHSWSCRVVGCVGFGFHLNISNQFRPKKPDEVS